MASNNAYGPQIPTDGLELHLDCNNAKSYPGAGTAWYDLSGKGLTHTLSNGAGLTTKRNVNFGRTDLDVKCMDCTGDNYIVDSGTTYNIDGANKDSTLMAWAWALSDATVATWRTLWRSTPNDHQIIIQDSTDKIGFYDNNSSGFVQFGGGYGIRAGVDGISENWTLFTLVGRAGAGTSTLYINDGTLNESATETTEGSHNAVGSNDGGGQPFGYVSTATIYSRALTPREIKQVWNAMRSRFGR